MNTFLKSGRSGIDILIQLKQKPNNTTTIPQMLNFTLADQA